MPRTSHSKDIPASRVSELESLVKSAKSILDEGIKVANQFSTQSSEVLISLFCGIFCLLASFWILRYIHPSDFYADSFTLICAFLLGTIVGMLGFRGIGQISEERKSKMLIAKLEREKQELEITQVQLRTINSMSTEFLNQSVSAIQNIDTINTAYITLQVPDEYRQKAILELVAQTELATSNYFDLLNTRLLAPIQKKLAPPTPD